VKNPHDRGAGDSLTPLPADSTVTQFSAGMQLGPYLIEGPLGAGGMGQVFRARDTRLRRAVAIKVSSARFSDRFEREARAISSLNHPHICTLYDVGPNYLVMELVEGTPLKGPLPPSNALQYAGQICDALDAAHRKGIVHRDLKPANILLTKQGVKVLDFGLAHMAAEPGDPTLTQAGAVMGTPAYMAPEQWDGKQADARSDLYSLGSVLYEMLTGKRPSPDWSDLEAQPPALASVVRTCLQREPDDRWQSAGDFKRALMLSAMERGTSGQGGRPKRYWIRAWIAAATMLILGAGLGVGVGYLRPLSTTPKALQLALNPPEGERFVLGITEGGVALSPDGNTVAYVASNKGKSWLWIQLLDSATGRVLPGTEGAAYPFWSPDGRSIGFFAGDKLLRLDLGGGEPSVICSTQTGRGATWTQDGRIVFGGPPGLFLVSAAGGSPTQITKTDSASGEVGHRWPEMLPGGHFLYWVAGDKPENSKVYISSLSDSGTRVQLLISNGNAVYAPGGDGKAYLLWLRGETLVAQELDVDGLRLSGEPHAIAEPVSVNALSGKVSLTASAKGTLLFNSASNMRGQLTWFDRAGRPMGTLVEPGEYSTFRLSSDGHRVVAARDRNGGVDLWMLEVDRNLASRLTSNSGVSMFPAWFPDA
jgi:predicted Ser/Thr protein kinase